MSLAAPPPDPRFPLTDPATVTDPAVRAVFEEIERELGFGVVPNIFRAMAIDPANLRATWNLFRATILQGQLPRAVKEIIGVVVSAAHGSDYALKVHLHSLSVQGVPPEVLRALHAGSTAPSGLAPGVVAMLKVAHLAASRGPLAVGAAEMQELQQEGITDAELGEFFATINLFCYVNSFTDLARVPVDTL